MHDKELELLARQLADGLRGDHDAFCRELVRLLAGGHPVTPERLATALQMKVEQVAEALAGLADLEVDHSGHVVGWGLTFVPTPHRFRVHGQQFYTWCALDALTYPVLLQLTANVESSCPVSGPPVTLSVTPTGIHDLTPAGAMVSLMIPEQGSSCNGDRGSFCNQTQLEAIAQAVCKRQERYQRTTHLFDQLVRLLVQGRPVAPELLASRFHRNLDEVRSILRAHPELEYDAQGNLVGSGLTLVPTAHQFQVEQRTLFAWCAFDTLTYPLALHLFAQVTSRCPVTGSSIHLTVTPEQVLDLDPGEAQVSLVVDVAAGSCHNVREDVCNYGYFFASREAAFLWQAAHQETVILSVEEAYQVGKLVEGARFRDTEP